MANLSTPNPNGQDPAGTGTGGEGNDVYDLKALMVNASQSDKIHSYMGIVSGCVAGVLGLLNWQGIGTLSSLVFLGSISIDRHFFPHKICSSSFALVRIFLLYAFSSIDINPCPNEFCT